MASKRAQLKGLVRHLRQHLEWELADGAAGVEPASAQLWARFEARREAAEKAKIEAMKAALTAGPAAPASRPAPQPAPGLEQEEPQRSSDAPAPPPAFEVPKPKAAAPAPEKPGVAGLWKEMGSRPRPTFGGTPSPAKSQKGAAPAHPAARPSAAATLQRLREHIGDCTRCGLCEGRTNIVFGVGNPDARMMIVGEAPGYNEDQKGEPFVGRAGELLDKMVGAMGLSRSEIYIANVIKCRPPENRNPAADEIRTCAPFLARQITAIEPEVIVAVGRFSSNLLTGNDGALSAIRGSWQDFKGIPVMPTYHPAYLLRSPEKKGEAWDDLQMVMAKLGLEPPRKP